MSEVSLPLYKLWDKLFYAVFWAVRENDVQSLRAALEEFRLDFSRKRNRPCCPGRIERILERQFSVAKNATLLDLALVLGHDAVAEELRGCMSRGPKQAPVMTRMNAVYAKKLYPLPLQRTYRYVPLRPISMAFATFLAHEENFTDFCKTPGRVRWDLQNLCHLISGGNRSRFYDNDPEDNRAWLAVPCLDHEEHIFKKRLLQMLLTSTTTLEGGGPRYPPQATIALLLEHGASAIGWTPPFTAMVNKVCFSMAARYDYELSGTSFGKASSGLLQNLKLNIEGRFLDHWNIFCYKCCDVAGLPRPRLSRSVPLDGASVKRYLRCKNQEVFASLLPVILSYWRSDVIDVRVEVVDCLRTAANLPWLTSLSQIPYSSTDNRLHDGPTCDHADLTSEQRQVSLSMCFRSGAVLETLQTLSRDVILSSLLHNDDVIVSVEALPLPGIMKKLLLGY